LNQLMANTYWGLGGEVAALRRRGARQQSPLPPAASAARRCTPAPAPGAHPRREYAGREAFEEPSVPLGGRQLNADLSIAQLLHHQPVQRRHRRGGERCASGGGNGGGRSAPPAPRGPRQAAARAPARRRACRTSAAAARRAPPSRRAAAGRAPARRGGRALRSRVQHAACARAPAPPAAAPALHRRLARAQCRSHDAIEGAPAACTPPDRAAS
jgi:hypothetical protein